MLRVLLQTNYKALLQPVLFMLVCLLFPVNLSASRAFLSIFPKSLFCWHPKWGATMANKPQVQWLWEDLQLFSPFLLWNSKSDHWTVLHDSLGPGQTSQVPTQALLSSRNTQSLWHSSGCSSPEGHSTQFSDPYCWTQNQQSRWPSSPGQEMLSPFPLKHASRTLQGHQLRMGRSMENKLFVCSQLYHGFTEYINLCKPCFKA